jgi:hypothetical protein
MAGGPWAIEIRPGEWEPLGCFNRVLTLARKIAGRGKSPVLVQFRGGKTQGNRDIMKTDFLMYPNGRREPEVDQTWWTHGG